MTQDWLDLGLAAEFASRPVTEVTAGGTKLAVTFLGGEFGAISGVCNHVGGPLGRKRVEQGSVVIKRPGRMRWEYKSPEKKLFVSNGKRLSFYDHGNNQVTLSEMPAGDDATSAALFLTGRGNLTRDFNVSFLPNAAADSYALKLEPKRRQSDFDWLELVVDRQTFQLRTLTAISQEGGRDSFAFSSIKENTGAADKVFEFEIPRGAEVIHAGRGKS